jgi:acyl-CoA reductase-like NAD-dependent aldehyde dehydrogenase
MASIRDTLLVPVDPRTGAEGDPIACTSPVDVTAGVVAARARQRTWAALSLGERRRVVRAIGDAILARAGELADMLVAELGKPAGEAWTSELVTTGELFDHWLDVIEDELAPYPVDLNPVNYPGKTVEVRQEPVGVIGMIMPWNYPVNLPLRTVVPALLAGNAVVWKPSEHAARCGALLGDVIADALERALGAGAGALVTTVQGGRVQGEALVDSGVDHVVFVGSVPTGRAVARRAAERGIPVSLELGSKDPALVLHDADLARTARGVAWGAFHNAGQDCASVERCFVDARVHDAFVQALVAEAQALRIGDDVGPLVNADAVARVQAQVDDALAKGAVLHCGGRATGTGFHYPPTVLTGCTPDMLAMREETFGPLIAVAAFTTEDEAVERANDTEYGLCASVWSRDRARAEALALRVECGVAFVNNCCFTGPMGGAAWVGRKASGGGVTGSRFALDALVRPRTVCVDAAWSGREVWWYPYTDNLVTLARGLVELGRGGGARLAGAGMAIRGFLGRWK